MRAQVPCSHIQNAPELLCGCCQVLTWLGHVSGEGPLGAERTEAGRADHPRPVGQGGARQHA